MIEYTLPSGEGQMFLIIAGDGTRQWKITCNATEMIRVYANTSKCVGSANPGTSLELSYMGNGLWKVINDTQVILYD